MREEGGKRGKGKRKDVWDKGEWVREEGGDRRRGRERGGRQEREYEGGGRGKHSQHPGREFPQGNQWNE